MADQAKSVYTHSDDSRVSAAVKDAEGKAKKAADAQKSAEKALADANRATLRPEDQKVRDAMAEAEKAQSEAGQAMADLQQAKADVVLERKVGRKLSKGEFARWINGNRNDNKRENLELCSPQILETEAKTKRHVNGDDMEPFDEAEFSKAHKGSDGSQQPIPGMSPRP